jgi:GTP cyclohydrolase II
MTLADPRLFPPDAVRSLADETATGIPQQAALGCDITDTSQHMPGREEVVALASAPIPTAYGVFEAHVFRGISTAAGDMGDHVALTCGQLQGKRSVLLRVHSECMTSEVFGSLKCDCRDQLAAAQQQIAGAGSGLVVYLRQEGRGIGLAAKLQAYALQAQGADTVDANRQLGLPDDSRRYDVVASVLAHFGVQSVRLLTNNPEKVRALRDLGVSVESIVPLVTEQNPHSAGYLEAKRVRMGHWLPARRTNGRAALCNSNGHAPKARTSGAGRA